MAQDIERVFKKLHEQREEHEACDQETYCVLLVITTLPVQQLVNLGILTAQKFTYEFSFSYLYNNLIYFIL